MALRTPGVLQELAFIAVLWMQLVAGISTFVFKDVSTSLPHLYPMKWLLSVRSFLNDHQLSIEMELDYIPQIQRENDLVLMDHVVAAEFNQIEIRKSTLVDFIKVLYY